MSTDALTPMMQQYQRIRRGLPAGTLLLFRLGDFYELFFDDAKDAAGLLNVALTKRNGTPMCGIPHHAAQSYLRKLLKAGRRVAVCDQVGDPQPGRIVEREVTQILSPGTTDDAALLDAAQPHFLAAVVEGPLAPAPGGRAGRGFGFACLDLTTGDFRLTELPDAAALADELARVRPAEVLVSEEQATLFAEIVGTVARDGYTFLHDQACDALREHFGTQGLHGFGCADMQAAVCAAGAIVHYLKHEMRRSLVHVTRLLPYDRGGFLGVDATTRAHLELVEARGGGRDTSLLSALDRTTTPMGARRLRDSLLHPRRDLPTLLARQAAVGALLADPARLGALREELRAIRDMERTLGRLTQAGGNARDLLGLRGALGGIPAVRAGVEGLLAGLAEADRAAEGLLRGLVESLHALPALHELLGRALVDEPPALTKEGGMFRDGYLPALDELRAAAHDGKEWIARLQQQAIDETGIRSLKVRYTSVFGYFIEVTKSNLAAVPAHWHRKQTVATGERFITAELKEVEGKILGADERARALETELWGQLRDETLEQLPLLQATAGALGTLDVLGSLAETARLWGYCRPELTEDGRIEIVDGRHPVLDQSLTAEKFVPNDTTLDGEENRLLLLTGPNMAGKSTYIRQVALLVLMAQIGSWIPARRARIGLVDRIFTRVGAGDDLSRGQSTFMVEMNETANITNNATARSLVVLDEIGRGTSTFDGLSIAWSVAEYLHDTVRARTLLATHYHEMTDLARTHPGVKNFHVAVREWNDRVIFLRKIVPGGADKSYGLQVARLAGLPAAILTRAREILDRLEGGEPPTPTVVQEAVVRATRGKADRRVREEEPELGLF